MTVYVDDMRRQARVGRLDARWSHLLADTTDELRAFATRLGLDPSWIQYAGDPLEHYDLTDGKRVEAIRLGAVTITYPTGVAALVAARRNTRPAARPAPRPEQPALPFHVDQAAAS